MSNMHMTRWRFLNLILNPNHNPLHRPLSTPNEE